MRGEAFWAGYDARLAGRQQSACPFPARSPKALEWLEGWGDKYAGELGVDASRTDADDPARTPDS